MKTYIKDISESQANRILSLGDELNFGAAMFVSTDWLNNQVRIMAKCSSKVADDLISLIQNNKELYKVEVEENLTLNQTKALRELTNNF